MLLTVQIVDLEEEDELLVGALPGELMHRLDELGHADGAVLVAVEDAEGALHEEGLQKNKRKKMSTPIFPCHATLVLRYSMGPSRNLTMEEKINHTS